jgi:hypothetical protein
MIGTCRIDRHYYSFNLLLSIGLGSPFRLRVRFTSSSRCSRESSIKPLPKTTRCVEIHMASAPLLSSLYVTIHAPVEIAELGVHFALLLLCISLLLAVWLDSKKLKIDLDEFLLYFHKKASLLVRCTAIQLSNFRWALSV